MAWWDLPLITFTAIGSISSLQRGSSCPCRHGSLWPSTQQYHKGVWSSA